VLIIQVAGCRYCRRVVTDLVAARGRLLEAEAHCKVEGAPTLLFTFDPDSSAHYLDEALYSFLQLCTKASTIALPFSTWGLHLIFGSSKELPKIPDANNINEDRHHSIKSWQGKRAD